MTCDEKLARRVVQEKTKHKRLHQMLDELKTSPLRSGKLGR